MLCHYYARLGVKITKKMQTKQKNARLRKQGYFKFGGDFVIFLLLKFDLAIKVNGDVYHYFGGFKFAKAFKSDGDVLYFTP